MKKALHPAIHFTRFVTCADKNLLNCLVNAGGLGARAHQLERRRLPAMDRIVKLAGRLAGASFDNRAGDIAEVTGFLRAREDIEDDGLVRAQEAEAFFMRIT